MVNSEPIIECSNWPDNLLWSVDEIIYKAILKVVSSISQVLILISSDLFGDASHKAYNNVIFFQVYYLLHRIIKKTYA